MTPRSPRSSRHLPSASRAAPIARILRATCALSAAFAGAMQPAAADEMPALIVLPGDFVLSGPEARQRILVQEQTDGAAGRNVAEGATFRTDPPNIVRIEHGTVLPLADGTATITAVRGNRTASATVRVERFGTPHRWSFRNHVQPVLAKTGCNSGPCHGAAAGKNGFKLSLRGYDSESDFLAITRQSRGRRIVPEDPARSLFLTKPSGAVPHQGGVRFDVGSREYRILAQWLADGQAAPGADDPRIARLEILPPRVLLAPGDRQPFVVRATFSDGRTEDVTDAAKFVSVDQTVAKIDDAGRAEVVGRGEGAVVAWHLAQNVVATIASPWPNRVEPAEFDRVPRRSFVDEHVLARLRSLRLAPSEECTDAEFLRRASLDAIGVLPSPDEVRAFLADGSADKRDRLVDSLLARPEYVDRWTAKWSDLLLLSGERLRPKALDAFSQWIRGHVERNTPWDRFVREIVTAKGSTFDDGAANFYALHQDPLDMAETASMAFLGLAVNCARCHDHPLEKWTNDDYYAFAGLFARVRGKGWGGDFRSGDGLRTVFVAEEGELIQPRTGRPRLPRPLDGTALSFDDPRDRREALADWLVSPENPYFARAIANRIWAHYLGRGLVESVDDLRLTNPASNPALLDALAARLVERRFDLKDLMREILRSSTYRRSSRARPENIADDRFHARFQPRRLPAEVLLDALSRATDAPTEFKDQPPGTRALQLRDSAVASYFLSAFGRPERLITCECERSSEPSMVQVLHLANGDTLAKKLAAKEGRVTRESVPGRADADVVEEAYLACLSRFPTDGERAALVRILAETPAGPERRAAIEDLYWSLLTSKDFLFQR